MEANDLRIGNLLIYTNSEELKKERRNKEFIVTSDDIACFDEYPEQYQSLIKPIPLTEEWLLKFGFKLDGDYYVNGQWLFEFYPDGFSDFLIDNTAIPIKHVHQLQNLYHALTQTELVI
jgi:hypothetical protein